MRIQSGETRGHKLKTRERKGTQPTDALARETLFNTWLLDETNCASTLIC
ncbi:MAG TPA: RsmD family RNA methyltransferase [Abditibacteriaceae bacterium]|jgi:16S rRNA G966 N2-methylase RsmD